MGQLFEPMANGRLTKRQLSPQLRQREFLLIQAPGGGDERVGEFREFRCHARYRRIGPQNPPIIATAQVNFDQRHAIGDLNDHNRVVSRNSLCQQIDIRRENADGVSHLGSIEHTGRRRSETSCDRRLQDIIAAIQAIDRLDQIDYVAPLLGKEIRPQLIEATGIAVGTKQSQRINR